MVNFSHPTNNAADAINNTIQLVFFHVVISILPALNKDETTSASNQQLLRSNHFGLLHGAGGQIGFAVDFDFVLASWRARTTATSRAE